MDIDVQKELAKIYKQENTEMLEYIYFEIFEKRSNNKNLMFKELIQHSLERYPEILNVLLVIKKIDFEKYCNYKKSQMKGQSITKKRELIKEIADEKLDF